MKCFLWTRPVMSAAVISGGVLFVSTAHAAYPASYFTLVPMNVPVATCVDAVKKAALAAGLTAVSSSSVTAGGRTSTTRGYGVCVRRPNDGDCNGDGATAVLFTAGQDAKTLLATIKGKLKIPVFIDCGISGNPVER